jgi:hypothetical protein
VPLNLFLGGYNMEVKLKQRMPFKEYLQLITEEVNQREQDYNEEMKENNPEKYIRNEFKITCR